MKTEAKTRIIERILPLLVILCATICFFDSLFEGKLINNSYYLYAYEPWEHYATAGAGNYNYVLSDDMDAMSMSYPTTDSLRAGKLPLWNTRWQLGIPEFRIDSGWFYPLRVFWVLFGTAIGMTIEVLLRFFLSGAVTYLLLTLIGISPIIAIVGALGYVFGSNAVGDYMYGFGPIGLALPFAIYGVERVIRFRRRFDVILLTLALIFLNTHIMVHVNAMSSLWVALYAAIRILFEGESRWRCIKLLLISIVFAPLIYSIALLPTLDFYLNYFNSSYREGYSAAQLHPGGLLGLLFGRFFGDPLLQPTRLIYGTFVNTGIFIGFLIGACGVVLAVPRLLIKRDKFVICAALCVFALLLTIYNFPFERAEAVFTWIPLLKFIKPFYQKLVFQFFVLLLGALGLDYFWRLTISERKQFALALALLLGTTVIATQIALRFYLQLGESESQYSFLWFCSYLHIAMVAVLVITHPVIRGLFAPRVSPIVCAIGALVLIGATVWEAKYSAKDWIPYSKKRSFYPPTQTTNFLKNRVGYGRIIALDRAAIPGLMYGYGLSYAAGRSLPRPEYLELLRMAWPFLHFDHPTQALFSLEQTDLLNPVWYLANVNYFVGGKDIKVDLVNEKYGDKVIIHSLKDGTVLERVDHSSPYLTAYTSVSSESVERTKSLILGGFDVRQGIILTDTRLSDTAALNGCVEESPKVTEHQIDVDKISATITNLCPAYFVPSMFYDKGWSAYVDGVQTPIYQAFGFMPAIKIEAPGVHRIEFRYLPTSILIGAGVSLTSLLIFLLVLIRLKAE